MVTSQSGQRVALWDSFWRTIRADISNAVSTRALHGPKYIDCGSISLGEVVLVYRCNRVLTAAGDQFKCRNMHD